jgi:DNA invertase Pin-like site-specific DNA recombinase
MKTCGYARVARSERAGLEWVKRCMNEKAAEQEVAILHWFEDTSDGTTEFEDRPGAAEMLGELEGGAYDTVVVWSMDRLGRTRTVAEAGLAAINSRGASVRVLTDLPVASNLLNVEPV